MTSAISFKVLRRRDSIRDSFRSHDPLPRFAVIEDFLNPGLLKRAVACCQRAQYSTFCAYTRSEDMRAMKEEFCEPNGKSIYVSVHERLLDPVALDCLREAFEDKATISALSAMTGIPLMTSSGGLLTCWQPGSFLECHTDYAPGSKTRLVVSLSLTGRWRPSYGGMGVFSWGDAPRRVRVPPRRNAAVLFVPYARSYHWVEQVSDKAPPRRRFTWTVQFW